MHGFVQLKTARRRRLEYYCCSRKVRNHTCSSRNIPRAVLEGEVLKSFENIILSLENLLLLQERIARHYQNQTTENKKLKGRLNHQRGKLRQQINNIIDAIADGSRSKALLDKLTILERQASELDIQINSLENEIEIPRYTPASLKDLAAQIKSVMDSADLQEKKNLLRSLISRVIVLRTNNAIRGMLYYIPPQLEYLRSSAPGEARTLASGSGGRRSVH